MHEMLQQIITPTCCQLGDSNALMPTRMTMEAIAVLIAVPISLPIVSVASGTNKTSTPAITAITIEAYKVRIANFLKSIRGNIDEN